MNRAATEDVRSPVWPVVSKVLRSGPAPSARDQKIVDLLDDWVSRDAPRLDARRRRLKFDDSGPAIFDEGLPADRGGGHAAGVRRPDGRPRATSATSNGSRVTPTSTRTCARCSGDGSRASSTCSYCGDGSLRACRASLYAALTETANGLAAEFGGEQDPAKWLRTADRTTFQPGLIPNTIRSTNRPTFQQVLEFQSRHR